MKTASVTEAKNGLSALLDRVKGGETVLITDRGVPVARIEPVHAPDDPTGNLERLARAGVIRPGTGTIPKSILAGPTVRAPKGGSVVKALLDERRTAR
jgi:prevent-host-death family protein